MEILQWLSGTTVKGLSIMVALALCLISSNAWASYQKKNIHLEAYTAEELAMIIDDYQVQINILEEQIKTVKKDMDWLVLKINRMVDSGQTVSRALKMSVVKKEKRIEILVKEKKGLEVVLGRYKKSYDARQGTKKEKVVPPVAKVVPKVIKPITTAVGKVKKPEVMTRSALRDGKRAKIEAAVKRAGLDDWVDVVSTEDGCAKIENTLPILFSSGSASLAEEYHIFLKKLSDFLKPYDVKVYVNGYADKDPIQTAQYPSNFELGASRAANVVHAMVKNGLKPGIFNIGSTGEHRFASKNPLNTKSFQRRANLTVIFSG